MHLLGEGRTESLPNTYPCAIEKVYVSTTLTNALSFVTSRIVLSFVGENEPRASRPTMILVNPSFGR